MNPDISLIRNTLWVLDRIGAAGLPEESLMIEIEIAAGRPLTTAQARDGIIFCKDNGWLASRRDDFRRTIYWITESGKNRLRGM